MILTVGLPITVALATIATLGYLFDRRRQSRVRMASNPATREVRKARGVATNLQSISTDLRRQLASHHTSIVRFKQRLSEFAKQFDDETCRELCREAGALLEPTTRLADQMAFAYDGIRRQSDALRGFSRAHTDPLTGAYNRTMFTETLASQLASDSRLSRRTAVVLLDIDHFRQINSQLGHADGDQLLRELAHLLERQLRDTDLVSRFGGDEFAILLRGANLEGACRCIVRLQQAAKRELQLSLSAGVSLPEKGDTAADLIARADAALFTAGSEGSGETFVHTGEAIYRPPTTELFEEPGATRVRAPATVEKSLAP